MREEKAGKFEEDSAHKAHSKAGIDPWSAHRADIQAYSHAHRTHEEAGIDPPAEEALRQRIPLAKGLPYSKGLDSTPKSLSYSKGLDSTSKRLSYSKGLILPPRDCPTPKEEGSPLGARIAEVVSPGQ